MNAEDSEGSHCSGSNCEELNLLTMEPIGNQTQDLKGFKSLLIATEICGVILMILLLIWIENYRGGFAWTSNIKAQFNWHPFLMVFGLIILYSQSMLIYRMFRDNRKKKLKISHAVLHAVAFILTVIALMAVFDFHNLSDPPIANMYSLHSWIGLTSVILFCCQYVAGFIIFLFPGLQGHHRSSYMPTHIFFGISGFILAITSSLLGLNEKAFFVLPQDYSKLVPEAVLINFIGVILAIFGMLVVYLVTQSNYKRLPKPEDETLLTSGLD